jgi:DNA-packaging protein gp3
MAKANNIKAAYKAEFYDKNKLRQENPALFPPPRKPTSQKDQGLERRPSLGFGSARMKNSGGHYPRYRSAEALEFAITAFFEMKKEQGLPPTMPGLALALGFKSTASLKNYEEKGEDYADIIETARTQVEEWKNEMLLTSTHAQGVIFDLKNNHGWADKMDKKVMVEAGDTLSQLLQALQGTVLRPTIESNVSNQQYGGPDEIEDAEYREDDGYGNGDDNYEEYLSDKEELRPQPKSEVVRFEDLESRLGISLEDDIGDLV